MRSKPKLIHPSLIVISQVDTSKTVYDDLLREPIRELVRGAEITLPAQVSWGTTDRPGFHRGGQGGPISQSSGYLVFHKDDLEYFNVTLNRGDRIISVAGDPVNLYLKTKIHLGHSKGEWWLEQWDLIDHAPQQAT